MTVREDRMEAVLIFVVAASVITAVLLNQGCIKLKQVGIDLGICASGAIPQEVANLEPAVAAIIEGNAPNWSQQLQALESVGVGAVVCAVDKIVNDLEHSTPPSQKRAEVEPRIIRGIEHGQIYLNAKGIKIK